MISVAMATYNGEKYITEQLQSIALQSRKVDEVIISDDGSTDGTVESIQRFIKNNNLLKWRLIKNTRNKGFNLNFYNAISHTKGDIIFLADQDDVWLSDKVEIMATRMECDPELLLLSSSYSIIDGEGIPIEGSQVINSQQEDDGTVHLIDIDSQICCSYLRGCAMCFRKKVFENADWENLSWVLGHDWTLSMTASLLGKNELLKTVLFKYRFHKNNTSLSGVTRKTLIGDRVKRVDALKKSVLAHTSIQKNKNLFPNYTKKTAKDIEAMIEFETRRYSFFQTKNMLRWITLVGSLKNYKRYYKSLKGAFKVYLGDFLYAYNINYTKR